MVGNSFFLTNTDGVCSFSFLNRVSIISRIISMLANFFGWAVYNCHKKEECTTGISVQQSYCTLWQIHMDSSWWVSGKQISAEVWEIMAASFAGLDSEVFVTRIGRLDADSSMTEEGWRDHSGKCIQVVRQVSVQKRTTISGNGEPKWAG